MGNPYDKYSKIVSNIRINFPEQYRMSFTPWMGVKVSGIVPFLKLMTLSKINVF